MTPFSYAAVIITISDINIAKKAFSLNNRRHFWWIAKKREDDHVRDYQSRQDISQSIYSTCRQGMSS